MAVLLGDTLSIQPKLIVLTSGTSWTVPSDWSNINTIHLIGGGGGYGGGGGGYTRIDNFVATPGSVITYAIGAGSTGDGGTTSFNAGQYTAGGGKNGSSGGTGGIGSTYNGGTGDSGLSRGGGAAGPYGPGNSAGDLINPSFGDAGFGGASGTGFSPPNGRAGKEIWGYGAGGGGINNGSQGGIGGLYGGGGSIIIGIPPQPASGAQGVIIIEYYYGFYSTFDEDISTEYITDPEQFERYVSNQLWGWGSNVFGALGINDATDRSSPVQTVSGGTNWNQVAGGRYHTSSIKTDGTLWIWGFNSQGQLGNNNGKVTAVSSPIQTVSAGTNWKLVSCGSYHTAAIKTDGTLWLWGKNTQAELGDGTTVSKSSPVQTISGGTNWKLIACSDVTTHAIKTDGTLWSWGDGTFAGQLGDNTSTQRASPVQTVSGGTNWKVVSVGGAFVAAIKTDGTLWLWGQNSDGGLGDNTTVNKSSPIQTVSTGTNWKLVACGQYHTASIKTDGTLWTWGRNNDGQLGDNTSVPKSSPVQTVSGGTNWKLVASGRYHTSAIKTDGTLWGWGGNGFGELGDNTSVDKSSPVQTTLGGNNWKQVSSSRGGQMSAITFQES